MTTITRGDAALLTDSRYGNPVRCALALLFLCAAFAQAQDTTLARQVEIRRTAYGVPHILAQNFKAAGYALGYVQMQDYGQVVPLMLLRARGDLARAFGH